MPSEPDATIYRRLLLDVWRELCSIRAAHQALQETLMSELPISARLRVLAAYDARRADLWEAGMLALEETLPSLAAELDKHRPLLSPDDGCTPPSAPPR
jgi:hypothetical protein